jgi:hypothetical protein
MISTVSSANNSVPSHPAPFDKGWVPQDYVGPVALPCDACADVFFGGVYWHKRDSDGANWGVAIMNGTGDFDGCLECVAGAREELRRLYSIIDEA